jgi:hypothetical protein
VRIGLNVSAWFHQRGTRHAVLIGQAPTPDVLFSLLSFIGGLPGALFPERTIRLGARLALGPAYENADELTPREWYVRAVRLQSVGAVVAGALGLLLAARAADEAAATETTD